MYVKYNSVYKVWQCIQSTSDESVTPDGQHRTRRDVSAARPQRSVRCPVPRTGAALGPARALRPDDLAAAAAPQQPAPSSGRRRNLSHTHTIDHLLPRLGTTCQPLYTATVLYTPCTVQPLYSNTPHTTVSLSATPRPWRRTLRYVQWNIFHTTSEIFLFLFYGTFNPRLWMTWMYLCSDNHHHDIVSIYHLLLKNISSRKKYICIFYNPAIVPCRRRRFVDDKIENLFDVASTVLSKQFLSEKWPWHKKLDSDEK